jgi:hypothetical protein
MQEELPQPVVRRETALDFIGQAFVGMVVIATIWAVSADILSGKWPLAVVNFAGLIVSSLIALGLVGNLRSCGWSAWFGAPVAIALWVLALVLFRGELSLLAPCYELALHGYGH